MEHTIYSRKLRKYVTYSRPGKSYIYVDLNGQPGTLGNQICDGGALMGSTLTYFGDCQIEFETKCRNWHAKYIASCSHG